MEFKVEHFLDVLFNSEDHICLGKTPYDVATIPIATLDISNLGENQFVAVNPFIPETTRKDENVSEFRNILFEFDEGTLDEQVKFIYDIELPLTTLVYSGGKSLHAIISLQSPCTDLNVYRELVLDLYAAVSRNDQSCKNPSRFTRLGGQARDNGVEQTIIDCRRERTTEAELQRFCLKNIDKIMQARALREPAPESHAILETGAKGELSVRTKDLLRIGAREGASRRRELYIAACDFKNQGYGLDETQSTLSAAARRMGLEDAREVFGIIARGWRSAPLRPRVLGRK